MEVPRLASDENTCSIIYIYNIIIVFLKLFYQKTCLYNFDPLKPHFYIVKLGFTGVYIIFLISFLFVCVEVLRPSQPNWVMPSAVSLPNHKFYWTGLVL